MPHLKGFSYSAFWVSKRFLFPVNGVHAMYVITLLFLPILPGLFLFTVAKRNRIPLWSNSVLGETTWGSNFLLSISRRARGLTLMQTFTAPSQRLEIHGGISTQFITQMFFYVIITIDKDVVFRFSWSFSSPSTARIS